MTKTHLTIDSYMTASPHTAGADQTLNYAREIMREYHIRHLPVLRGGELVGILSDRDLALIEKWNDVDPRSVKIEEAMSSEIFTVSAGTRLDSVADEMSFRKIGSTVVLRDGKVAGIFTLVDACKALGDLIRARETRDEQTSTPEL